MHPAIHVKLPVTDLQRPRACFAALGFEDPDGHVRELLAMTGAPGS